MSLEHELRTALKRKEPPSGFDDRVLSRIARGETARVTTPTRTWAGAFLPIAATLLLAFGATYYMQQQQRDARAAQAATEESISDVVLALQVASDTVAAAQAKVEEMTRYEPKSDY
jgi:uncharacterized membrane protein YidH (DUF202 family)